jgi:UDP-glucose 4-epimerase
MNILITGGAGYIGSHCVREVCEAGHSVFVLDNLSHGHLAAIDSRATLIEGSTGDVQLVSEILRTRKIEAVMHFAADIEVGESVENPGKYYENNFSNALRLLGAMRDVGVKKIVFSSTAAVYGDPEKTPIEENQPRQPINPYGRSKMMTEMAIEDFSRAHGLGYVILRYFNVVGAAPDGSIGEDHQPESHLLPRLLAVILDGGKQPAKIFGTDYPTPDGTCVRDYVHVVDLAQAHLLALKSIEPALGEIYNVGSESGFSVKQVITACEKVTGRALPVLAEGRRGGDSAVLVASSQKIRQKLGWKPAYPTLEIMVAHAWKWHTSHPRGYDKENS